MYLQGNPRAPDVAETRRLLAELSWFRAAGEADRAAAVKLWEKTAVRFEAAGDAGVAGLARENAQRL
jgi:hypothetical protein